jgi:hypothetical protein
MCKVEVCLLPKDQKHFETEQQQLEMIKTWVVPILENILKSLENPLLFDQTPIEHQVMSNSKGNNSLVISIQYINLNIVLAQQITDRFQEQIIATPLAGPVLCRYSREEEGVWPPDSMFKKKSTDAT